MALVTYDQIQDSIRRYLWDRNDLSGLIPDWIVLCEARLNDNLRVAQMGTSASITLTAGSGTLPTDYLQWRRVVTADSPIRTLDWAEPDWVMEQYPDSAASLSGYFTIIGTAIKTAPTSSSNLTMHYYKTIPPLASNMAGNWITARSPGLYIYGTLLEAAPFLDDDPRVQTWGTLFTEAQKALQASDTKGRYAKSVMRVNGYTP